MTTTTISTEAEDLRALADHYRTLARLIDEDAARVEQRATAAHLDRLIEHAGDLVRKADLAERQARKDTANRGDLLARAAMYRAAAVDMLVGADLTAVTA